MAFDSFNSIVLFLAKLRDLPVEFCTVCVDITSTLTLRNICKSSYLLFLANVRYDIGPRKLFCGTPVLTLLCSEYGLPCSTLINLLPGLMQYLGKSQK